MSSGDEFMGLYILNLKPANTRCSGPGSICWGDRNLFYSLVDLIKIFNKSFLLHRKLSFLEFCIRRMHLHIMSIEFGSGGLDRELPVNLDAFGHTFSQKGQHFPLQFIH